MIGNIVYLHLFKLPETLAVKQSLDKHRFVKIIEETPVQGGKQGEQYIKYKGESLYNSKKVYEFNNYLSPFNYSTLEDLDSIVESLKNILLPSNYDDIINMINEVKAIK